MFESGRGVASFTHHQQRLGRKPLEKEEKNGKTAKQGLYCFVLNSPTVIGELKRLRQQMDDIDSRGFGARKQPLYNVLNGLQFV